MTATVSPRRRRPRIVAIFLYTLQSCVPPKRWFALLLPCLGAVMFGLIARTLDFSREQAFGRVGTEGLFSLMLPIAALIIGDAVLGAEMRAGTFHFTWLSPTPTWQIVTGRWAAGSFVALVTIAPACALAAVVAGTPKTADAAYVAAAFGSAAYIAVFIAIGCMTRRTAIWSLAFVFLVERLLGEALTGIAQLSPTWLSRSIFVDYLDDRPDYLIREGIPHGAGAAVRLIIVTVVVLLLANWRMHHMRLSGASD
jgi:ABC-type transport system involved in multi-copper enzyme maturation permease subunit